MPAFLDYDPSIGGYRLIVLTADAPRLEVSEGHRHEEGYSRTWAAWEYDADAGEVVYTTPNDTERPFTLRSNDPTC